MYKNTNQRATRYCGLFIPEKYFDKTAEFERNFDWRYFIPITCYTPTEYLKKIGVDKNCCEATAFYNFIYYQEIILGIAQKSSNILITLSVFVVFGYIYYKNLMPHIWLYVITTLENMINAYPNFDNWLYGNILLYSVYSIVLMVFSPLGGGQPTPYTRIFFLVS